MDGTLNEVDDMVIAGFPTMFLFKKDNKTAQEVGSRGLRDLVLEVSKVSGYSQLGREGMVPDE